MGSPTQAQQEEKAGSVKMFLGISVVAFVIALVVFVLMVSGTIGKIRKSTRTRLAGTILDPEYKTAAQRQIEELRNTQTELANKTMAAQARAADLQARLEGAPKTAAEFAARQQAETQAVLNAQRKAAAEAAVQARNAQTALEAAQKVQAQQAALAEATRAATESVLNPPEPTPAPTTSWWRSMLPLGN